jgi:hypothetical protein
MALMSSFIVRSNRVWKRNLCAALAGALLAGGSWAVRGQSPPPDASWTTDAIVDNATKLTDQRLGACQGIAVRDGRIYAYGDVYSVRPRVGVIREYDMELKPTGREVWLRQLDRSMIIHPTGLTWDDQWGTLLGDTVRKKATIYRLDWQAAWRDGNLDNAIRDTIIDDAAINGCRPTFVALGGRKLIATADYGDVRPEIRLYDPELLFQARHSSVPGVVVHRVPCGPFNQNLYWDAHKGQLVCVQNVIEGRGWRLDVIDLARAVALGRAEGPGVRVKILTFSPHDELEGFWPFHGERSLFVTSRREGNIIVGTPRPAAARTSPPGSN